MAGDIAHGIIIDFGPLSIKCQRYNYVTYIHVTYMKLHHMMCFCFNMMRL